MKRVVNLLTLAISFSLAVGPSWVWAAPRSIWYLAYHGDELGLVLSTIGLCPLWGAGRNVEATVNLNPQLRDRNSDHLKNGEVIYLPVSSLTPSQDYEVTPSGELKLFYMTPLRCSEKAKTQSARYVHPKYAKVIARGGPTKSSSVIQRKIASEEPIYKNPNPPSALVEEPETVTILKEPNRRVVATPATAAPEPVTAPVTTPAPAPAEVVAKVVVETPVVAPAPVVTPVPEVLKKVSVVEDDEMVRSWIGVAARVNYQKYSGTDLRTGGRAVVLSEATPGLNVSWSQEWTDLDKTWISLGLDRMSLVKPKNRELVRKHISLSEAQFGYQRELSRRFYGGLRVAADQVATYDALTATTLDFPSTTFLKAGGYLGFKFFRTKKMSLGLQAGIFGNAPSSNSSTKFSAGFREREYKLVIDHRGSSRMMSGSFYGRTEQYVSPFLKQTQSELGFELGIHFQFLGD